MDWRYKHFQQERVFAQPRDVVVEVASAFMKDSLGWEITDLPEGFSAKGKSFLHNAVADFRIRSDAAGTKVTVDLRVERASPLGFMLFDVGGYYTIQIRKWLDGIQWAVHEERRAESKERG